MKRTERELAKILRSEIASNNKENYSQIRTKINIVQIANQYTSNMAKRKFKLALVLKPLVVLLVLTLSILTLLNYQKDPCLDHNHLLELGTASEVPFYDVIHFKVTDIDDANHYLDSRGEKIILVTGYVIENYNDTLEVESNYSEYLDQVMGLEQKIKMIVTSEMLAYVEVENEYVVKLGDNEVISTSQNNVIREDYAFDISNSMETLFPVVAEKIDISIKTAESEDSFTNEIALMQGKYIKKYNELLIETDYLHNGDNIETFVNWLRAIKINYED